MTMTVDMAQRAKVWQDEVMTVSKQIAAAQAEFKEASSTRLKKKHTFEELQGKLATLCERGPFGEDDDSPGLLDSEVDGDSTRTMNFPRRVFDMLDRAGIETVSRLQGVIDGEDSEYVGGLDAILGMDVDARDRIMAQFNDENDDEDVPDTIPYTTPLSSPVPASPKNLDNDVRRISLRIALSDALPIGTIVEAMLIPSGQAIVQVGDEMESEMLETGEFDIVE